jgi:hypothetical protein
MFNLLQSSYFLVFYHFGFETTTLTFSRIIDFDDATNLFLKQVYSCAVVDACLIWTDLIILISRLVHLDKLYQSTHFKGKLHKLPITNLSYIICIARAFNDHRSCQKLINYWSGSSSRHFLWFLSNILKKQSRNLCFTPLLFSMNHNDLPTKWIFTNESARWSGIHYYDVAFFNRTWTQQKQFSPTFRNIVFCEAKASKGKKNDILEN